MQIVYPNELRIIQDIIKNTSKELTEDDVERCEIAVCLNCTEPKCKGYCDTIKVLRSSLNERRKKD